jgi:nicotinamide-nucleotide amidase
VSQDETSSVTARPIPRVEVLSLGEELLIGIRENSHLVFLGQEFIQYGIPIHSCQVVGDGFDDVKEAFDSAWENADILITTGGLGPTQDDRTREAVAKGLGVKLIYDPMIEGMLRQRFERSGRKMPENNLRQAWRPEGSQILPNLNGTAPGIWFQRDNKFLIMLPGPPNELQPMFHDQVIPLLQKAGIIRRKHSFIQIRTCGLGESMVETRLLPIWNRYPDIVPAYCFNNNIVDVRISEPNGKMSYEALKQVARECRDVLGDDFVCFGDCPLGQIVFEQLRRMEKTLALAESCTGGLLSNTFTEFPGSSKVFIGGVVCYANEAKSNMLGVPESILQQHGAVSNETAIAMATGVAERLGTDYAIGITGFAGPGGGTPENPVGTVYIGFCSQAGVWSHRMRYTGSRNAVKIRAAYTALDLLRRHLNKEKMADFFSSLCCDDIDR